MRLYALTLQTVKVLGLNDTRILHTDNNENEF